MRNIVGCVIVLAIAAVAADGCAPRAEPAAGTNRPSPSSDTERAVRAVIAEQFQVDAAAVPMDQPISNPPLMADELDLVEIVMELEERLGIEISDAAIERESGPLANGPVRITPNQFVKIAREASKAPQSRRKK